MQPTRSEYRETFSIIGQNSAQILAGTHIVIENRVSAEKNQNLPHNALTVSNQSTSCTLFIFLDNFADQDKPDYILFPSQQITVGIEDGVSFSHLFIKNTHAADAVAAKEIKYKVSTIQRYK